MRYQNQYFCTNFVQFMYKELQLFLEMDEFYFHEFRRSIYCGFFYLQFEMKNCIIFIYLEQKILENIFCFISNNPIILTREKF